MPSIITEFMISPLFYPGTYTFSPQQGKRVLHLREEAMFNVSLHALMFSRIVLCTKETSYVCYLMCVCVCVCVSVKLLSYIQPFATLWTIAHQAPLPLEFSQQEYWSGLLFLPPRNLPNPGIRPTSPAAATLQAHSLPLNQQRAALLFDG